MSRLLIITQRVDEADDLLGFFVEWVRAFSLHFDEVNVITLAKGQHTLPANVHVHSLGKERAVPKWRRLLTLCRLLISLTPRHTAVFAHMSPIFAIVAWPFTKLWHKKLVLWYLHRSVTLRLRLALAMCDTVVTADAASLIVKSPKIISVGHGIDVARFSVPSRPAPDGRPLQILSVGRLSPIKGFETLILAAAKLKGRDFVFEVRIVGRAVMRGDREYESDLRALVARLGLDDVVKFVGFIPYRDMPAQYRWADVVVGCTPPGGIDKALLEAMAAGCIPMTSNTVMRAQLGQDVDRLVFPFGNAAALAEKVEAASFSPDISGRMVALAGRQTVAHAVNAITALL